MRPADTWVDYELIDATNHNRLERWGKTLLIRPDPQIIWKNEEVSPLWARADAIYYRSAKGGGQWDYHKKLPQKWNIKWQDLTLIVSPTGFKHTGVFPEQAVNWAWYQEKIKAADRPVKVYAGNDALEQVVRSEQVDTVVMALVGYSGLFPTASALRCGKKVALANKECLVVAGELITELSERHRAPIIPVDSEHSAIFQCLMGCRDQREVKRLILTCSGGPFFGKSREELASVTKADALRHPNWKMGAKITIDCATLMNKGLEIIEAMRLYELPLEKVTAVIHRQSVVHSLVEFVDGAVLAQLGVPDMRIPIGLAMTYPNRLHNPAPALDLLSCGPLTFDPIDEAAFPCFALAKEAAKTGGTACTAMNAANEEAVALYLQDRIGFYDIPDAVAAALRLPVTAEPSLDDIFEADRLARAYTRERFSDR